jgi:hypothetical protein
MRASVPADWLAAVPEHVSNHVSRTAGRFSAAFGGDPGRVGCRLYDGLIMTSHVNATCSIPPESPSHTDQATESFASPPPPASRARRWRIWMPGDRAIGGPDYPRFVQLIKRVTMSLFPPQNTELRRGHKVHRRRRR